MSLKNVTAKEHNEVEIEFTIDKETFDAAVDRAYKKNVKRMNVPGFRRGKAPKHIIEKMYGKGVFYDDALNDVLPDAYTEALEASKADVVSQPEFDVVSIDDNGVVMKAVVYVKPEVELKKYKGLKADRVLTPTTDAEVDAEIERVRHRNSRTIDVTDRAAQTGDIAVIDYEGFTDGVAFEGGKGETYELELGSGHFIPGFEEQIVGHNPGDAFDVELSFPEEYHAKELAGKPAVFKTKLNAIKFNELPVLDDEFAKDVSEFDTLAEYKASVKARIEEQHTRQADNVTDEKLMEELVANLEADIPVAMIDSEVENSLRDYDNRLRMQGLDLSQYTKYTGMTLDDLRGQFRPRAEQQVKTRLALEKVAALEGIEADEADVEKEYTDIANAYNIDVEAVRPQIDPEMIKADVKVRKAVEFVRANAKITEKTEGEEAPKKKSTTSKSTTAKKKTTTDSAAAKKPAAKKSTSTKSASSKTSTKKTAEAKKEDK